MRKPHNQHLNVTFVLVMHQKNDHRMVSITYAPFVQYTLLFTIEIHAEYGAEFASIRITICHHNYVNAQQSDTGLITTKPR